MKQIITAIADQKVTQYKFGSYQVYVNVDVALRAFSTMRRSVPIMHDNPEDFDLYMIGEVDPETGMVYPCNPKLLLAGSSLPVEDKQ